MKSEIISKTQYRLLVALKESSTGNRKPTLRELSIQIGVCLDTVETAVQHLIAKGYIVRETRYVILRFPDEVREIKNEPRRREKKDPGYNKRSLEAIFRDEAPE